mmetsp:Transcript_22838/g.58412  ORF Transcript_22838/g.58412 Transcript_22838/m.58412 type:complete len:328 (-) Transcript_22838:40-1023(-)
MAAAMLTKPRLIGGAWTAIGTAGGYSLYRSIRDFEDKSPCVREAVHFLASSSTARATLGGGDLMIARWPRHRSLDLSSGLARASFEVRGDAGSAFVVVGARRRARASQAYEQALDDDEDEELAVGTGWRRYWSRPWELKQDFLNTFRSQASASAAGFDDEEPIWDIDSLFILPGGDTQNPVVLAGNPVGLPEYEAMCVRRDAESKGEKSRWRLRVVTGIALMAAGFAGGARVLKSMRVSQSYGFVRRSLQAHSDVNSALGRSIFVQSSSGTFGDRYISARLRLVGDGGAVADVEVAATRGAGSAPWIIAMARMSVGGLSYNLDRSQF